MAGRFAEAVVIGRSDLTERISEFKLALKDGAPLPAARAGAHVEIRFGGAQGQFLRHYSIVGPLGSGREAEPFWRIAVQREMRARGSDFIHRTFAAGTPLLISPAQSPFRMAMEPGPVLLIAGGIGITAMLPMLRSAVLRGIDARMVYAGRSRDVMAYADVVEELGGDRVRILTEDRQGRPDFAAILAAQPEGATVYMCGPAGMMAAVSVAANALGWPSWRVRSEIFNAAHRPEDRAFTLRLRSGREIAVPAGMTILDALEAARVDTLSDCRRGECGLCITELARQTALDHRDRFLTAAEKAACTRLAICCSRPEGDLLELDI